MFMLQVIELDLSGEFRQILFEARKCYIIAKYCEKVEHHSQIIPSDLCVKWDIKP